MSDLHGLILVRSVGTAVLVLDMKMMVMVLVAVMDTHTAHIHHMTDLNLIRGQDRQCMCSEM